MQMCKVRAKSDVNSSYFMFYLKSEIEVVNLLNRKENMVGNA